MIQDLRYIITDSTDPFYNLALEEQLLLSVQPGQCILYLWQNRNTVVIGRNQNPWTECRIRELEEDGGFLARRLSGGGAVYHDLGNLNFTFLVRHADYDVDRQLSVIQGALRAYGLDAEKTGRNDVTIGGRKCSGNAFYKTGDMCYHHGTLLIDVDMGHMSRLLQVSREKLAAKGVASVRARVVNLRELNHTVEPRGLAQKLVESFGQVYGLEPKPLETVPEAKDLEKRRAHFASWSWRFGAKASFRDTASARFPWGGAELCYTVENGRIAELALYSDGLEADFLAKLPTHYLGCPWTHQALEAAAKTVFTENDAQTQILRDCTALLQAQME